MPFQFVTDLAPIGDRPEIDAIPGAEFARALPRVLGKEVVMPALREMHNEITAWLNSLDSGKGPFQLDEVEMTVNVDHSGKVTIFMAEVGGSVSGGFQMRWKRRPAGTET
jgi:hypothetical protein